MNLVSYRKHLTKREFVLIKEALERHGHHVHEGNILFFNKDSVISYLKEDYHQLRLIHNVSPMPYRKLIKKLETYAFILSLKEENSWATCLILPFLLFGISSLTILLLN